MLDPTALLSTLFGGLLAIIGSVVTNYYIQFSSNKTNKQKEIRNLIEQIYKYTRDTYYLVNNMEEDHSQSDFKTKTYRDFQWNLLNIEMLINLYLAQLKEPFRSYSEDLNDLIFYIQHFDDRVPPQAPQNTSLSRI